MTIDTNTIFSMTEANQNFSRVARTADQYGQAVVFKNNSPAYLVIKFSIADKKRTASDEAVMSAADSLMVQFDETFKELA